jgi:hypothetical protein
MVSGKPSNQSAQQVDIPPTTRNLVFLTHRRAGVRSARQTGIQDHVVALQTYVLHNWCAYGPTVACGGPAPRPGMKGKRLLQNDLLMFQACVLGLPCKVEIRFRNRPFLVEIETAYPFYHIE